MVILGIATLCCKVFGLLVSDDMVFFINHDWDPYVEDPEYCGSRRLTDRMLEW